MEFFKNLFTNDNSVIGLCGFEDGKGSPASVDWIFSDVRESFAIRNVSETFEWRIRQRSCYGSRFSEAVQRRTALLCNYAPPVNLMYKNQQHLKNIFGT